jgi:ERCC4 domain
VRATVPAGDYAVQTTDGAVVAAVERKSLENLAATLSDGTLAFQLQRLAELPLAAVVVESRYSALFKLEHVNGSWLADQLARLEVRYPEVHLVFADSRRFAEKWTYRFLTTALADASDPIRTVETARRRRPAPEISPEPERNVIFDPYTLSRRSSSLGTSSSISGKSCRSSSRLCASSRSPAASNVSRSAPPAATATSSVRANLELQVLDAHLAEGSRLRLDVPEERREELFLLIPKVDTLFVPEELHEFPDRREPSRSVTLRGSTAQPHRLHESIVMVT